MIFVLLFFHLPFIYLSLAISFFEFYLSSFYHLFKSNNNVIAIVSIVLLSLL